MLVYFSTFVVFTRLYNPIRMILIPRDTDRASRLLAAGEMARHLRDLCPSQAPGTSIAAYTFISLLAQVKCRICHKVVPFYLVRRAVLVKSAFRWACQERFTVRASIVASHWEEARLYCRTSLFSPLPLHLHSPASGSVHPSHPFLSHVLAKEGRDSYRTPAAVAGYC